MPTDVGFYLGFFQWRKLLAISPLGVPPQLRYDVDIYTYNILFIQSQSFEYSSIKLFLKNLSTVSTVKFLCNFKKYLEESLLFSPPILVFDSINVFFF